MRFERTVIRAMMTILIVIIAHLSAARAAEIFGGKVADEVALPGECAGSLQATESLPLRPALIRFSVSPDGQWLAVSCELANGAHAVFVGRQGVWRKLDTKESLLLRAWTTNGRGLWMPFPASLRLTDRALWFANFQAGAFVHPARIGNGTLYYSPLASGAVVKVFERPPDGQFGTFTSDVIPSRDDVVVMQGFTAGQPRIIRLTPDGKSEYLPVPSGFTPLYAAPLGPSGAFLSMDGQGKAFIGGKAVTGLPQRESVMFAANNRAFVSPAGDNLEVHEVLPNGSLSSLIFPATARPIQPGAASSAGVLVEGGGFLNSWEFDTLYLGTSRLVKTGDVILGVRISSFWRHATAIDDNGEVYFSPSGITSRVFRLSTPRVVSVSPSSVSQGQDFVITGEGLWIPGGPKTDLILGAGAPVDPCSARSSGELLCSSKNFPLGKLTFRVRLSDGKTVIFSQPAEITITPPPTIKIDSFTLSRPAIVRGETVDVCFQTSEAPSDGWFLSFKGKTGSGWGLGIGALGQTNQVLARSATMIDNVRVFDDRTCVSSRPSEDGEFHLQVGARGNRASAGPLPVTVEVPKPRLTACEGEPSAVMPMQGAERLTPGGLARFCGEFLDGSSVEVLSGFSEAGDAIPEALETLTTTSTEVVAKLPLLAGEIWIRVAREGLVSEWTSVYIAQPPPPETPEPAPEPAPEPGEVAQ